MSEPVDLIAFGEVVLTMADGEQPMADGAVVVSGDRIVAVTSADDARTRFSPAATIGGDGTIVMPGLVNAHQHLTGDRLIRSTIPDHLDLDQALRDWALPAHAAHTPELDELSATLALVEGATNGITFTVEAGTVAHPERVLAAFETVGVGGTLGSWGWDTPGGVHAGTVDEVIERQRATLAITQDHPTVQGWVTLVGHDLMSDELVVAASELATDRDTGFTFHMSPSEADARSSLARTGRRPFEHLDHLGVLGPNVVVAHALHVDDGEIDVLLDTDTAVACCPWAYLRLGQGVTRSFHHPRLVHHGGRVALGTDSENAGDAIDIFLAARLFAGLANDTQGAPTPGGADGALRLATIDGARALGFGNEVGSLEVGKRADLIVVDASGPAWTPHAADPTLALVWASDGRSVRDVVAAGRIIVSDGRCQTVNLPALSVQAHEAHQLLIASIGAHSRNQ